MAEAFTSRLKHAWNVFMSRDPPKSNISQFSYEYANLGLGSGTRPDRPRMTRGNERSIVTAICNRIAMDCASIDINHVKLDENNRFISTYNSGLNTCLTLEANKDQTGRAFVMDVVLSMLDEGCVAVVPVETSTDLKKDGTSTTNILSMRTGKIVQWYPDHVKVNLYNDRTGMKEDLVLPKSQIAIIENPLYPIMNEQNSTLQRLVRKLNLLDAVDEQSGAGKLDLIIQLPYAIKTDDRRKQAENRKKDIEMQLAGSKYGIAYTDATEKITQLNRSVDNNLMNQIQYLMDMLYSQLGITKGILEGTANETEMLNYNNRTIEPILTTITDEYKRKFLSKTARSQRQSIVFFRDPFKLVPINQMADIADKFTRNEILSSNEVRQIVGMKPVDDAKADELRNKNINSSEGQTFASTNEDAMNKPIPTGEDDSDVASLVDGIVQQNN